jgi:hypothetical protein
MTAPVHIALVEIAGSHDECLYTQVRALAESNCRLYWVTSTAMKGRNPHLVPFFTDILLVDTVSKPLADLRKMKGIVRYLQEKKVEKVVFNTAQGGHVRNLALIMPKHIVCYGLIHTLRKFQDSFTQKVIHRMIKKYVVLSDDLLTKVKPVAGIEVSSFYPIDFPKFEQAYPKKGILVTLTGGVENRRKDLKSFIEMCSTSPAEVHFVFLGKSDMMCEDVQVFVAELESWGLRDRVTLFPEFVDQATFDAVLKQTDFLLPLIHPNTPSSEEYIHHQISGAFTLAYAYRIPLLIHEAYSSEKDLIEAGFFYTPAKFREVLTHAISRRSDVVKKIASYSKWDLAQQHAKFREFVEIAG